MKKAAIIFLVLIYAASSTGFAMKADYCCNHLTSLKLVLANGAKDKEGCCKVKYQSLKVNDAHAAAHIVTAPHTPLIFIDALVGTHEIGNVYYKRSHLHVCIHAPPLIPSTPVYISHCTFRI